MPLDAMVALPPAEMEVAVHGTGVAGNGLVSPWKSTGRCRNPVAEMMPADPSTLMADPTEQSPTGLAESSGAMVMVPPVMAAVTAEAVAMAMAEAAAEEPDLVASPASPAEAVIRWESVQ
jgi:hypothetical protein